MASAPFSGLWSSDTVFTGNSQYALDQSGTIWLVSESTQSGGSSLYRSTDQGISFTLVTPLPLPSWPASPVVAFDPALAIDANGVIHLLGQVPLASGAVEVAKFSYDPATQQVAGPFTIDTGLLVASDYDLVALANGNTYAVVCGLTAVSEAVVGIEIEPDGTAAYTDSLVSQTFRSGSRFGTVSLYSPDGLGVEIYLESHPKMFAFSGLVSTLSMILRSAPDAIAAPVTLTTFSMSYVDPNLTVIGDGTARYLSLGYYTTSFGSLVGNMLLGYLPEEIQGGPPYVWSFRSFVGSAASSLTQPTLSVSPAGVTVAYVNARLNVPPPADSPVSLMSLDPVAWTLSSRSDFPYQAQATWLRGTKSVLPQTIPWSFIAQQAQGNVARFYTGYNAPPVVVLSPATLSAAKGTSYILNAGGSYSPNLDELQFSWTIDDPTGQPVFTPQGEDAVLLLPKSAGPGAATITVTVAVNATDSFGDVVYTGVSATSVVTYPAVAPPVIEAAATVSVARNATSSFTPVVTDDNSLTYQWQQTGGTDVVMTSDPGALTLSFSSAGAAVAGETLTFSLTVSDGMNAPVTQSFSFAVQARQPSPDSTTWRRSTWPGTIAQRNVPYTWPQGATQGKLTNFTVAKRANLIGGSSVYLLISPWSVLVATSGETEESYYALTPNYGDTILDAVHSDTDATLILTAAGLIHLLPPNAALTSTDNATATIVLSDYTPKTFSSIAVTPSFNGTRVLTLSGAEGVFLLEVVTSNLTVAGFLDISVESGLLYGSDTVRFVRCSDVESLRSGELLIGTQDASGNSYETQISLSTQTIIGTWDSSNTLNQDVTTGELLFMPSDSYAGQPLAPVLAPAVAVSGKATLIWAQDRPDLVNGYYVFSSADGEHFTRYQRVGSGATTSVVVSGLQPGSSYWYYVQALSNDGPSPVSNTIQVSA